MAKREKTAKQPGLHTPPQTVEDVERLFIELVKAERPSRRATQPAPAGGKQKRHPLLIRHEIGACVATRRCFDFLAQTRPLSSPNCRFRTWR